MRLLLVLGASLFIFGCGGGGRSVISTRGTTKGLSRDLSGYWNDQDAQHVVKTMMAQCLGHPWLADFKKASGGERPVVKIQGVIKKTDDRNVNTQFFTKQVERRLLKSGTVRIVASDREGNVNARERDRQAEHASDETAKSHQNELGADFTLQTIVSSQNDTDGEGQSVRAYLINMELINVETNETVWIGEDQVRKVINQAAVGW